MSNPFEDDDTEYLVLLNDEEQYSLWPGSAEVPGGWRVAMGPATRTASLAHISRNWVDMRPKSLIGPTVGG